MNWWASDAAWILALCLGLSMCTVATAVKEHGLCTQNCNVVNQK
jgi:hypothetical protein